MKAKKLNKGALKAPARSRHLRVRLGALVRGLRREVKRADEPRFQALLETSAEVLRGLETAFVHYDQGRETAWRRK